MEDLEICSSRRIQALLITNASFSWIQPSILGIVALDYLYHQKRGKALFFYLVGGLNVRIWYGF